ncbi:MAG: hypothetical protein K8R76_01330 [Candidatus Aegiribacteria sp.]|nr:hypothetical protein [Candidatus Aegiribacteria sp.]
MSLKVDTSNRSIKEIHDMKFSLRAVLPATAAMLISIVTITMSNPETQVPGGN